MDATPSEASAPAAAATTVATKKVILKKTVAKTPADSPSALSNDPLAPSTAEPVVAAIPAATPAVAAPVEVIVPTVAANTPPVETTAAPAVVVPAESVAPPTTPAAEGSSAAAKKVIVKKTVQPPAITQVSATTPPEELAPEPALVVPVQAVPPFVETAAVVAPIEVAAPVEAPAPAADTGSAATAPLEAAVSQPNITPASTPTAVAPVETSVRPVETATTPAVVFNAASVAAPSSGASTVTASLVPDISASTPVDRQSVVNQNITSESVVGFDPSSVSSAVAASSAIGASASSSTTNSSVSVSSTPSAPSAKTLSNPPTPRIPSSSSQEGIVVPSVKEKITFYESEAQKLHEDVKTPRTPRTSLRNSDAHGDDVGGSPAKGSSVAPPSREEARAKVMREAALIKEQAREAVLKEEREKSDSKVRNSVVDVVIKGSSTPVDIQPREEVPNEDNNARSISQPFVEGAPKVDDVNTSNQPPADAPPSVDCNSQSCEETNAVDEDAIRKAEALADCAGGDSIGGVEDDVVIKEPAPIVPEETDHSDGVIVDTPKESFEKPESMAPQRVTESPSAKATATVTSTAAVDSDSDSSIDSTPIKPRQSPSPSTSGVSAARISLARPTSIGSSQSKPTAGARATPTTTLRSPHPNQSGNAVDSLASPSSSTTVDSKRVTPSNRSSGLATPSPVLQTKPALSRRSASTPKTRPTTESSTNPRVPPPALPSGDARTLNPTRTRPTSVAPVENSSKTNDESSSKKSLSRSSTPTRLRSVSPGVKGPKRFALDTWEDPAYSIPLPRKPSLPAEVRVKVAAPRNTPPPSVTSNSSQQPLATSSPPPRTSGGGSAEKANPGRIPVAVIAARALLYGSKGKDFYSAGLVASFKAYMRLPRRLPSSSVDKPDSGTFDALAKTNHLLAVNTFFKLLKDFSVIPHLLPIDLAQDVIYTHLRQLSRHNPHLDVWGHPLDFTDPSHPGMSYHEFLCVLGSVAIAVQGVLGGSSSDADSPLSLLLNHMVVYDVKRVMNVCQLKNGWK